MGYYKLEEKRLGNKKLSVEIESIKQQQEQYEIDIELKKIELQDKLAEKLEKRDQIKKEILSKNISQKNIEIPSMSHIMYGNIPTQMDGSFLQHSYHKSNS